jgi:precorrin-6B C5,15-methyltransferase / cobalt-precorrin-6B C5,C15-methyltransferase
MGDPWLCIVGLGEDGLAGLSKASLEAVSQADVVFGGPRHLKLANVGARGQAWQIPFSIEPVIAARGRKVVVLASGDPFWFGAGSRLAEGLDRSEWTALPAPSTFSIAAARLGWRLEDVVCLGLHAVPLETLRRHLAPRQRLICLVRDGEAVGALAGWLTKYGFGASSLHILETLGGASERIRETRAERYAFLDVTAPVAVSIEAAGSMGLSRAAGLPDDAFAHDGQITKRPVRALTLAALAPRPRDLLWDIGAGSGSISIEWCLAGARAIAIEARSDRVRNIQANAAAFGVARDLTVIEGKAPTALEDLAPPQAVFLGGGADAALLNFLWARLAAGTQLVVNAVTLETESLLLVEHARRGGELLRIDVAHAAPLGSMRGWVPSRPVIQWSVIR